MNSIFVAVLFILIDVTWITLNRGEWETTVSAVQQSPMKARVSYAVLSYVALVFGLLYFVQSRITKDNFQTLSLREGFLWGVTVYAVFDFTNLAIFKDYPITVAIKDMLWGGTVSATALYLGNWLAYRM